MAKSRKLNERKIARFIIRNGKLYKYVPTKQGLTLRYISNINEDIYNVFGDAIDIIAEYVTDKGITTLTRRYATVYEPKKEVVKNE